MNSLNSFNGISPSSLRISPYWYLAGGHVFLELHAGQRVHGATVTTNRREEIGGGVLDGELVGAIFGRCASAAEAAVPAHRRIVDEVHVGSAVERNREGGRRAGFVKDLVVGVGGRAGHSAGLAHRLTEVANRHAGGQLDLAHS